MLTASSIPPAPRMAAKRGSEKPTWLLSPAHCAMPWVSLPAVSALHSARGVMRQLLSRGARSPLPIALPVGCVLAVIAHSPSWGHAAPASAKSQHCPCLQLGEPRGPLSSEPSSDRGGPQSGDGAEVVCSHKGAEERWAGWWSNHHRALCHDPFCTLTSFPFRGVERSLLQCSSPRD